KSLICLLDESCRPLGLLVEKIDIKSNIYKITLSGARKMILQSVNINTLGIMTSEEPYTSLEILKEYEQSMNRCLFGDIQSSTIYIASDEYTNNMLISSTLNVVYKYLPEISGMKGILNLLDTTIYSFEGKRKGLNLYEEYITLNDFMKDE